MAEKEEFGVGVLYDLALKRFDFLSRAYDTANTRAAAIFGLSNLIIPASITVLKGLSVLGYQYSSLVLIFVITMLIPYMLIGVCCLYAYSNRDIKLLPNARKLYPELSGLTKAEAQSKLLCWSLEGSSEETEKPPRGVNADLEHLLSDAQRYAPMRVEFRTHAFIENPIDATCVICGKGGHGQRTLLSAGGLWDRQRRDFSPGLSSVLREQDLAVLPDPQREALCSAHVIIVTDSQIGYVEAFADWLFCFLHDLPRPAALDVLAGKRRGGKTFVMVACVLAAAIAVPVRPDVKPEDRAPNMRRHRWERPVVESTPCLDCGVSFEHARGPCPGPKGGDGG